MEFKLHGAGPNRWGNVVSRGQVQSYHDKPNPVDISGGAKASDIANLKKAQRGNLIESFGDYRSRFTIGFEVEKNSLHRGAVREYELLCGFERDGSCGYEAVTHVLPLVPHSQWRTAVFDMMFKAEKIISDNYSPSNSQCGGHSNIGVEGLTGDELRVLIRSYSGIIMALFRNRLKNTFCRHNLRMQGGTETGIYNGWHSKYQMCLVKSNIVEFRVVAKFDSVKQMMRRYELFYELVDYSLNVKGSYNAFLKRITPIITSMYNGDTDKVNKVLGYAKHFQKFINDGSIHPDIRQYL
jgi:hypothetical protein